MNATIKKIILEFYFKSFTGENAASPSKLKIWLILSAAESKDNPFLTNFRTKLLVFP